MFGRTILVIYVLWITHFERRIKQRLIPWTQIGVKVVGESGKAIILIARLICILSCRGYR
jgi:hypothetical protein